MRALFGLLVTALLLAAYVPMVPAQTGVHAEPWATGLDQPVSLAFDAEGRLYYAELASGHLRQLLPNGTPSAPLATVPASPGGNGGFTGIAADPDRAGVIYAQYSMEKPDAVNGKVNRVVRLDLAAGEETVLLDNLRWAELHVGGRLAIGPEGDLYVTTGDNDLRNVSADPASYLGKVLRMTRAGEPAPGNPEGWHPLAYAKGFRNPFGITVAPDGTIYVSDNGGSDGRGDEEINRLQAGANYGWPACSGTHCDNASVTLPVTAWEEHFGPTGLAVHEGTVYLGDYVFGQVRTFNLETGERGVLWQSGENGLLDVQVGPDACLYMSTWDGVWRTPLGDGACGLPELPSVLTTTPDSAPQDNDTGSYQGPPNGGNGSAGDRDTPLSPLVAVVATAAALGLARLCRR